MALLQLLRSASSGSRWRWFFESSFESEHHVKYRRHLQAYKPLTFLHMRQQGLNIVHQVSHAMRYSTGGQEQYSLLIPRPLRCGSVSVLFHIYVVCLSFSFAIRTGFESICLLRFKNGSHVGALEW